MSNRPSYGNGFSPRSMHAPGYPVYPQPGDHDQSQFIILPLGAHINHNASQQQEGYYNQQQAHFPPLPGMIPPPGFFNQPPYLVQQQHPHSHVQSPPSPHQGMYFNQQHPFYKYGPPPPPPPPHQHYQQPPPQYTTGRPMYSQMTRNNLPTPQPLSPPRVAPQQTKKAKEVPNAQKKYLPLNPSNYINDPEYADEVPAGIQNKAAVKRERPLLMGVKRAKEAVKTMFPQLNGNIQAMVLRLVLEDSIHRYHTIGYKATDDAIILKAVQEICSQPTFTPRRCHQKLVSLKEAYLNGEPFQSIKMQVVSFKDGEILREYPWLATKSEQEIASVAQELSMMLPAALKPLPLAPLLEEWHRRPEEGWLELDIAAVNAAQSKIKHGKLVDTPRVLHHFASTPAARELATATLQKLDTACALLSGSYSGSCGGLSELYLTGQADFGMQTIINPITSDSSSNSSDATADPASLLSAMLTTGTASTAAATADNKTPTSATSNALEFRHLTFERGFSSTNNQDTNGDVASSTSPAHLIDSKSVLLLGGFAAPQLPSTFTTIDNARLFWSDRGNSVIKLEPGQHHDLTLAMCRLNSPERSGESGILQQAVVVFIAVGEKTETYSELARIQGASFVDVYANYTGEKKRKKQEAKKLINNSELGIEEVDVDSADWSGDGFVSSANKKEERKGTPAVATLGFPTSPTEQPLFRIFACARRVSVALLDATQLTATTQLRVDAKPFIPPRWKQAFDLQPSTCLASFSASTKQILVVDSEDDRALVSAASKKKWATTTHIEKISNKVAQKEGSVAENNSTSGVSTENYQFTHPVLRRYNRLLHLEELAKEQDICRHDVYNAQLHLAVFAHSNPRKFTEVRLTDPSSTSTTADGSTAGSTAGGEHKISKGMYRGPAITHIFETPLFTKAENNSEYRLGTDNSVYVLGMLRHPGLSEGRPSLVIGDAVHLRPVFNPDDVEIVCLVASIDGDIVYLVMPHTFWSFSHLKTPLTHHAVKLPAGGGSSSSSKGAATLSDVPKDAFNGRVHVRFSFDRRPFMHMQNALRLADQKRSTTSINLVPAIPGADLVSTANNTENDDDQEKQQAKWDALQPSVAAVEEISSKLELLCGRSGAPLNTEQRHAVSALVAGAGRASPYALHGPPGTGKTVTMVSAALQLLNIYPESRLLLCAPQNYSADLLTSSLRAAGLKKHQVLRLNDPRRPPYSAKEDTMNFTLFNSESGLFEQPESFEQLQSYSVVISTCTAAAMLYQYYASFTHVLIDESGQALLPEALIPLALLSPPPLPSSPSSGATTENNSNTGWGALLCGDPQQLGPTVHSIAASASGLSSSLLERLINAHWQSSPALLQAKRVPSTSMLLANYRSHASLLNLPSKLFYRGQLVAAADPDSVLPPQWKETMNYGNTSNFEETVFAAEKVEENGEEEGDYSEHDGEYLEEESYEDSAPTAASLMFYGVRGQQMRESDIPSYHNPLEAAAIADLVQGLLDSTNAGVKITDIGIMATYRRQVQSIRLLLRERGLGAVRVGTVDDYQGQEERIVFISTVLTKPSSLPQHLSTSSTGQHQHQQQSSASSSSADAQFLGLWNNPKRFNVAITRAKALLVVVGHPAVLLEDPSWKELLRHCASIGAFRGAGAEALAERLGMDLLDSGILPGNIEHLIDNATDATNNKGDEMAKAIDQMASLALLGVGDAAQMFPETLEEAYASYADEMEWRIML